jgi:single-strand DNA-binding protein
MAYLNKAMIIGNVGSDPEMRFTPKGNSVTTFRIATSRFYLTPEGEHKKETEWFRVVCWNRLAENCNQFLTKGKRAYVEGRLQTRTWEGQDGQRHFQVEIVADHVLFLDRQAVASLPGEAESGEPGVGELPSLGGVEKNDESTETET